MTEHLFALKKDFDMYTIQVDDKLEIISQQVYWLTKEMFIVKNDIAELKADVNKMDGKLNLIIKHFKI